MVVAHAARKTAWQTWFAVEAVPIYAVVGLACGGAGWYLTRLARHPDVIWDRKGNPTPWNDVAPGTNTKLMDHSGTLTERWSRPRL